MTTESTPNQLSLIKALENFYPPIDKHTQAPTWHGSQEVDQAMIEFYQRFSDFLESLPEAKPNTPDVQNNENNIKVVLSPRIVNDLNNPNERKWTIIPTYKLPDGTTISFFAQTDHLRPEITLPGDVIPMGYGHEANRDNMLYVLTQIESHPEWRLSTPTLDTRGLEEIFLRQALENNLDIIKPESLELEKAISAIPASVKDHLQIPADVNAQLYPSESYLLYALRNRPREVEKLVTISLTEISEENTKALPIGYKNYGVQVITSRQADQVTLPLDTSQKSSFEILSEIMERDSGELNLIITQEFYESYQTRISKEIEEILRFLAMSIDVSDGIRQKAITLIKQIRSIRKPDLQTSGVHYRGPVYEIEQKASQKARKDLGVVMQVKAFFEDHKELEPLMVSGQNTTAVRVTNYLNEIVSIMTDLERQEVSDNLKNLLKGKTATGNLAQETPTTIKIEDFSGGLIAPSYKSLSAEIACASLELVIDIKSSQPRYYLRIGSKKTIINNQKARELAKSKGLEELAEAHFDGLFATLPNGETILLPNGSYYLNPKTGLAIYSENVTKRNKEEDKRLVSEELLKLNPSLDETKKAQAAELIVARSYQTVSANPERMIKLIRDLAEIINQKTPTAYEEVDFTELATAFVPYHSNQEGLNEEKFSLFCSLFGIDENEISTWCLNGQGITFRLYKIKGSDNMYLGVSMLKTDSPNRNNVIAYSYIHGKDLEALVANSKQQMIAIGVPERDIEERNPEETIGISDPNKGYTLREAIQSIFGK
ncbi:MAG: hypothetical protein N2558_01720 [Patescibacteria group bacterium]|nr:hypothetical protein [Patescibacteria group bacterium]